MDKKESIKKYYYDVIPSYNIKGTLLYTSDIKYEIGSIIRISLRKKEVLGCVLDILKKKPNIKFKVKDILENKYKFKFNKNIIDFLFFIKERYVGFRERTNLFHNFAKLILVAKLIYVLLSLLLPGIR